MIITQRKAYTHTLTHTHKKGKRFLLYDLAYKQKRNIKRRRIEKPGHKKIIVFNPPRSSENVSKKKEKRNENKEKTREFRKKKKKKKKQRGRKEKEKKKRKRKNNWGKINVWGNVHSTPDRGSNMTSLNVLLQCLILGSQLSSLHGSLDGAGGGSLLIFNSWRGKRAVHLLNDPQDPCHIYGDG